MTMLPRNAVNEHAKPSAGFTPMEPGDYTLVMIESDYVANAKGNGMVAKLQCQVIGGEYDGRPYYINLNLEHENQQAQDIAQRDFAALRRAVGVLSPQNTVELHNRAFNVKMGVKPRKDTGDMENVIKEYIFADGGAPANDNARPTPAAAAPETAKSRPWDKKA